jgi:hypothetical protein
VVLEFTLAQHLPVDGLVRLCLSPFNAKVVGNSKQPK